MIQSTHIFKKDVRHLWPELGLYSAFLLIYGWAEPLTWQSGLETHSYAAAWANLLLSILRPLFIVLWLLIISRLIHDESLVGDRQFWITKPYERSSLATAKLLFVVVCIILPFALMQTYLIAHAGLGVGVAIPSMLHNVYSFALVCWLPLIALAVVTPSLSRMILAALSVFLGFFFFTLIVTLRFLVASATPPFLDTALSILFTSVLIATLVFQYVTRRTTMSRLLLVTLFVGVGILHSAPPSRLLYKLRFPNKPIHLQYKPANGTIEATGAQLKRIYGKYVLTIPVQEDRLLEHTDDAADTYYGTAASYTINGPQLHYNSGWQSAIIRKDTVSVYVAPRLVDKISGGKVDLHIDVVGRILEPAAASVVGGPGGFDVPGHGHCLSNRDQNHFVLICRYAFASPPRTVLQEGSYAGTAPGNADATYLLRAGIPFPAFDPIAQTEISLPPDRPMPNHFSATVYQPAKSFRAAIEADSVNIAQYVGAGAK